MFPIALSKKTGTPFPIDINNQTINTLYDTGAGFSLINYSTYEVKSSTGENMAALGQVTYTFKINGATFTQSFIVCRHMTRPVILGTDFTATNIVGVIWTREVAQKKSSTGMQKTTQGPDGHQD